MKRVAICMILAALLALSVGSVHAAPDTSYSFTYYFSPAHGDAGFPDLVVCDKTGTLSPAPAPLTNIVLVGGPCPEAPMSMVYSGPLLAVTSVTYNLTVSCDQAPSEDFEVAVSGTMGSTPWTSLDCTGTTDITQTVASSVALAPGETINATVNFGELPKSTCFTCGDAFSGSMTVTGVDPASPPPVQGVPQFPLGMLLVLAVGIPAMLALRRRR